MTRLMLAPCLSGSYIFCPGARVRDVCNRDVDMHAVSSEDINKTRVLGRIRGGSYMALRLMRRR